MAAEYPTTGHDSVNFLQLEVETLYSGILDRYGRSQDKFFAACIHYANNQLSAVRHDTLEETEIDLAADLAVAVKDIINAQPDPSVGIAHAHGFILAADAMRVDLFRSLAPQQLFTPYQDSVRPGAFESMIPKALEQSGVEKIARGMANQAIGFLCHDTEVFAETAATGKPVTQRDE